MFAVVRVAEKETYQVKWGEIGNIHARLKKAASCPHTCHEVTWAEKKEDVTRTGFYAIPDADDRVTVHDVTYFYTTGFTFYPVANFYIIRIGQTEDLSYRTDWMTPARLLEA